MKILDDYFNLQKEIFEYFGYEEDWLAIPLDDCCEMYWHLTGEGRGDEVHYANTKEDLLNTDDKDNYYVDEIYTQRFLPKGVYRGKDFTMICCDPHTDCNHFLRIFDNSKEVNDL